MQSCVASDHSLRWQPNALIALVIVRALGYTGGMTMRVGPKGQVVIPKELRDELGIRPGDRIDFWLDGDHLAARRASSDQPLLGRFRGAGLTDALMLEHDADQAREGRV